MVNMKREWRNLGAVVLSGALAACAGKSLDAGAGAAASAGSSSASSTSGGSGGDAGGSSATDGGICASAVSPAPGLVVTDRGPVKGVLAGSVYSYKGIPYAAPPVGALRFQAPEPAACWAEPLDASAFGQECTQIDDTGQVQGQEDCLTLNVWTPSAAPPTPLPVLVFIYGGGNAQGASSQPAYDGTNLAAHGSVVVTINYRLIALGFMAHPALTAENPHHVSGNYGILDQQAALRWVQANAAAFGGDPTRVMLFGQSAGGSDVGVHLASPLSAGLFSRAVIESGRPGDSYVGPMSDLEQTGIAIATAAGCASATDASCLRSLSASAIALAGIGHSEHSPLEPPPMGAVVYPNIDGYVLTANPEEVVRQGKHNHVPMIVGTNAEETNYFEIKKQALPASTESDYTSALGELFGASNVDAVEARYPFTTTPLATSAFVASTTDANFTCLARRWLVAAASAQSEPLYRYYFTHGLSVGPYAVYGAYHTLELFFVFGTLASTSTHYVPSPAETALSEDIMQRWVAFAANGSFAGYAGAAWPPYDAATDPYLVLDTTETAGAGLQTDDCNYWDATWQP